VGRCGGAALKTGPLGRLVGEQQWSRGERCVQRRGGLAILLGRWVGVLRALVPVVAGMGRMPYPRFLAFNALGGVPWVTTVVLGGYFAGGSFQHLEGPSGRGGVALLAVPVVALALPLAWRCLVLFRRHVAAADIDRRPAAPEAH
jgi:membrane-associated protein